MTNDPVKQPHPSLQNQSHQTSLRQIAHDAIGTFAITTIVSLAIWLMGLVLPNAQNAPQPAPVIHDDFIER